MGNVALMVRHAVRTCSIAGMLFAAAAVAASSQTRHVHLVDDAQMWVRGASEGVLTAGRWELVHGMRDGRVGGTSTRSFHVGDGIQLRFEGDGVDVRGVTGPTGGIALVAVDREHVQRIDFYSPRKRVGVIVWTRLGLARGRHACTMVVLGRHDPRSRGNYVNVDAFEVFDNAAAAR